MEVIEFSYRSETEGTRETLEKEKVLEKILHMFNSKKIKSISVVYKDEPTQEKCTGSTG